MDKKVIERLIEIERFIEIERLIEEERECESNEKYKKKNNFLDLLGLWL